MTRWWRKRIRTLGPTARTGRQGALQQGGQARRARPQRRGDCRLRRYAGSVRNGDRPAAARTGRQALVHPTQPPVTHERVAARVAMGFRNTERSASPAVTRLQTGGLRRYSGRDPRQESGEGNPPVEIWERPQGNWASLSRPRPGFRCRAPPRSQPRARSFASPVPVFAGQPIVRDVDACHGQPPGACMHVPPLRLHIQ
jgi:hypothetical protein